MIYLYTFCVYINKHSKKDLINVLNLLIKSLEQTNDYELHVFTNFELKINNDNIKIHEYIDIHHRIYNDNWLNLSTNKIYIYKYLYDKYGINFIWIDLDTIVVHNLDYINDTETFFIDTGGCNKDPHILIHNTNYIISRDKWIQGNVWKINIELYEIFIKILNEMNDKCLKFNYDLQSLFTYYAYFVLDGSEHTLLNNNIFIYGRNIKTNTLNGLAVWNKEGNAHPNMNGLKNLYYENNILKSKFYSEKEIHILSFTFDRLKVLYNHDVFKKLF